MSTTHSPRAESQSTVEVEERIARYVPKSLTAEQAALVLDPIRDLVRRSDASTWNGAKDLLTTACRFVADELAAGHDPDLESVLTEARVAAWSHRQMHDGVNPGTVSNRVGLLRRLIRLLNGLPERLRVQRRTAGRLSPLTLGDFDVLRDVCSDDAWRVIVAGAGTGSVVPDVVGAELSWTGLGITFPSADLRLVLPKWTGEASSLSGVRIERSHWDEARTVATQAGIDLTAQRLTRTHAVDALTVEEPFHVLRAEHRLTRDRVAAAVSFLPEPSTDSVRRMLRGCD